MPLIAIAVSRLIIVRSAADSLAEMGASAAAGSESRSRSCPSKCTSPANAMLIGRTGAGVRPGDSLEVGSADGDGDGEEGRDGAGAVVDGVDVADGSAVEGPAPDSVQPATTSAAATASAPTRGHAKAIWQTYVGRFVFSDA